MYFMYIEAQAALNDTPLCFEPKVFISNETAWANILSALKSMGGSLMSYLVTKRKTNNYLVHF